MPQRNVYFYRAHEDIDGEGLYVPYDPGPALHHVETLGFDEGGRYLGGGDEVTCCWIDNLQVPQRVRLGKIRRGNLPEVESGGVLEPLDIPDDSGIAEQAHFVFFPNSIVGMLFNFYGPRMASLREYLKATHPDTPATLSIDPLLRQDVLQQLDQLGRIRVFNLKVLRPFLARLEQADESIHEMFRAQAGVGEAEQFQVVLQPRPYKREWIGNRFLESARRIADLISNDPDAREEVTKFKVRGLNTETDSVETVDLLKDRLVAEKQVDVSEERTRALDDRSAYRAIQESYAELEDQLRRAATVFAG